MEWLIGNLKTWAHAAALGPAALAKEIPSFVAATALAIPLKLKGIGSSVSSYARDMQDAVTLVAGRGTGSKSVYSWRIYENLSSFPALHLFKTLPSGCGQMASAFGQLGSQLLGSRRIAAYGAAIELEAYLFARLPLLQQLVGEEGASVPGWSVGTYVGTTLPT
jgi:hypothetical protein